LVYLIKDSCLTFWDAAARIYVKIPLVIIKVIFFRSTGIINIFIRITAPFSPSPVSVWF
jgi:hypothetical protein